MLLGKIAAVHARHARKTITKNSKNYVLKNNF